MSVQAGKRYPATLVDVASTESNSGNFGLFVTFKTDAGNCSRTLWFTPAAAEKTRQMMGHLGATDAELANWQWLQDPKSLCGRTQVSITTKESLGDDGVARVEVEWINSIRPKAFESGAKAAARLMGGNPEPVPEYIARSAGEPAPTGGGTDDSVPF